MLHNNTFAFLKKLAKNNNREYFTDDRKSEYKEIENSFKEFMGELSQYIGAFDETISQDTQSYKVFRIYRDVRFSKDKRPYKTSISGVIGSDDKHSPLYYLHLEPGGSSMIAGGVHMPDSQTLSKIRDKIAKDPKALKRILEGKKFRTYFGDSLFDADAVKTAPRGFDIDQEGIEYIRLKGFTVSHKFTDKDVQEKHFMKDVVAACKELRKLNEYLQV